MTSFIATLRRHPLTQQQQEGVVSKIRSSTDGQHRSDRCLIATAWAVRYLTGHLNPSLQESPLLAEACVPAIPLLIRLLSAPPSSSPSSSSSSGHSGSRMSLLAATAWALCSLASDLRNCMHIVDAGAIWPLVRLLRECHLAINTIATAKSDPDSNPVAPVVSSDLVSCKEAIASLLQNIGHYELRQVILVMMKYS